LAEVTLYTHPMSHGRIVRWLLEEIGTPYRVEIVDLDSDFRTPAFLALNPMGKVPVLTHGSAVVSESAAICAYLADAFPDAGLAPPPGSAARGAYYRWLFFAAGPLDTATMLGTMGFVPPPESAQRAPWGTLDRVIDTLDATLAEQDWLAGDRFSAADIYLGSLVDWGVRFGTLPALTSFETYRERLNSRPALIRAQTLDDKLYGRPALTVVR